MNGTSANPSPRSSASPAANRTVHVPRGSTSPRGTEARKVRDAMSTRCSTAVRVPVVRSMSQAPVPDTSSARSIPVERTPALAGHSLVPTAERSVLKVNRPTGTDLSFNVFQSIRHQVWVRVSPIATRKMSAPLRAAGPSG
ncbi:hypothetical protein AU194_17055 [Mycobacterium sp. GA-2829]|nr:hypothetical protein AU194_17055 [Mycobacterium sp. GA-2829]